MFIFYPDDGEGKHIVVWVPEGRRGLQYQVHIKREREREREINQFERRERRRVKKK
jgi:hypothetical protein